MIGIGTGADWGLIAFVCLLAVLFGLGWNWITAWAERTGFIRGYVAFFVVAGVAVTLALGVPLAGIVPILIVAGMFVLTGTPMIVGSMIRHKREELRMLAALRREANGDESQTLAK